MLRCRPFKCKCRINTNKIVLSNNIFLSLLFEELIMWLGCRCYADCRAVAMNDSRCARDSSTFCVARGSEPHRRSEKNTCWGRHSNRLSCRFWDACIRTDGVHSYVVIVRVANQQPSTRRVYVEISRVTAGWHVSYGAVKASVLQDIVDY